MIPPRTILAAIDFSDTSRAALVLAARMARHCRSALHVVHVDHPLLDAAASRAGIDLARETTDEMERFVATASPAGECAPQLHVVTGAAVEAILAMGHQHAADVIVVGGRGMSGAEKLFFGSTTEGLLRRASVSVLVVPSGWVAPRTASPDLTGMGPVVAGLDPSDASLASVEAACALASAFGASVEVLHVVPHLAVLGRWRDQADAAVRDQMQSVRRELEPLIQQLVCQVPIQLRVEAGSVPDRLAEAAAPAPDRAPMIVLGKKAPGTAGGAPGTIAYRVLSVAHVPVLMHVS
jgi:nucleotide-binding universal stress UspA family protein